MITSNSQGGASGLGDNISTYKMFQLKIERESFARSYDISKLKLLCETDRVIILPIQKDLDVMVFVFIIQFIS